MSLEATCGDNCYWSPWQALAVPLAPPCPSTLNFAYLKKCYVGRDWLALFLPGTAPGELCAASHTGS